jgi:hypothetical protein
MVVEEKDQSHVQLKPPVRPVTIRHLLSCCSARPGCGPDPAPRRPLFAPGEQRMFFDGSELIEQHREYNKTAVASDA